jgi:hypothetical protein
MRNAGLRFRVGGLAVMVRETNGVGAVRQCFMLGAVDVPKSLAALDDRAVYSQKVMSA